MTRRQTAVMLVAAAGCAAGAGGLTSYAGVLDRPLRVAVAAGAGLAAYVGSQVQLRRRQVLDQRHRDQHERYLQGRKAPLVRDVNDAVSVGIHGVPRVSGLDHLPPYVPRDVDPELHQALNDGGFVLLTGDAAVGKTRTAYEAMRAVLPGYGFFAPTGTRDVAAAMAAAGEERCSVLWLDSLQRYLGADAVTSRGIADLLAGDRHHRVVLATLRATEESRLVVLAESLSGGQLVRDGQAVLERVDRRIVIERLFSGTEKVRAATLATSDARIADALARAGRFGLAEYLSSGPALQIEWDNAWARGTHPRGAALITAAVDCRLAGFAAPLPRRLLDELQQDYLDQRGGMTLRPESLADAWRWATSLRNSASSPLWPTEKEQCYDVFDYLVDVRARGWAGQVPEGTIRAALRFAGPADATVIAATAWWQARFELAEAGFLAAYNHLLRTDGPDAATTLAGRNDLAVALHALGKLPDAEAEYLAILARRTATLGAEHPDTLTSRNNLAVVLHAQRRMAEAEAEYRAVLDLRTRLLGTEHPSTLLTRNNLGVLLRDTGRLAEARAQLEEVVRLRADVLGENHPHTVISRDNLSAVQRKMSAW